MKTSNAIILTVAITTVCCLAFVVRTASIRTASTQTTEHESKAVRQSTRSEEIYLHGDVYELDSVVDKTDRDEYESFLGRTPRQSLAWAEVARANALWKQSAFADAIATWQRIASDYGDTDAAYAALTNVALGCKELGEENSRVESLQLLLLLPKPTLKDIGVDYNNYRHDACVVLADHYEAKSLDGLAYKFLSQALEVDERHDTCGVYLISVVTDLKNRQTRLEKTLATKQGK